MMTNEIESIVKRLSSNLNKQVHSKNFLSHLAREDTILYEESVDSNLNNMKKNFLNLIINFTMKNFETFRENLKKETLRVCDNLNTSKIMLKNSLPPELLNTKMSLIIEFLSEPRKNTNNMETKRNCLSLNNEENDAEKNIRIILFDLKQIKEKLIESNTEKVEIDQQSKNNYKIHEDKLKLINSGDYDNKTQINSDKTPCFSKVKSQKEIRIASKKIINKENEETKTSCYEGDNKGVRSNGVVINNNNNFNLPKTKSTKLKDIKTFASRYRSPSPIITKKTKQVHTNLNFVKLKSESDLFNNVGTSIAFTPVKHENKSYINNSKPKSNNFKTSNNNHSPIASLPWLP